MLTSVGRVAVQRLAPRRVAASPSRCLVQVGRLATCQPGAWLGAAFASRTYASVGRPKKTEAAASATATKAKPRKTAATATKKAAPKKPKVKAAAGKTRTKPAVASPKKKKRKAPSEKEQLTAQKRMLKSAAMLSAEPKKLPQTAWLAFLVEAPASTSVIERSKEASEAFKALPASEMQRLENIVQQNKLQNAAQYKAWVESHPPQQLAKAWKARQILKRKFDIPKGRKSAQRIYDDRQPKRPSSAYVFYSKSRYGASSEGAIFQRQKQIASSWHTMSRAEQQPFRDLAEADKNRFLKEMEALAKRTE